MTLESRPNPDFSGILSEITSKENKRSWRGIFGPVANIRDKKLFAATFGANFVFSSAARFAVGAALSGATGFVGAAALGGVTGFALGAGKEIFRQTVVDHQKPREILVKTVIKEGLKGAAFGALGGLAGFGVAEVISNVSIPKIEIPIPKINLSEIHVPNPLNALRMIRQENAEISGGKFGTIDYQFEGADPLFGDKSSLRGMAAGEWVKAQSGIEDFDPFNGKSLVDGQEVHHSDLYENLKAADLQKHDKEVVAIMDRIHQDTLKPLTVGNTLIENPFHRVQTPGPVDYLVDHSFQTGEKVTVKKIGAVGRFLKSLVKVALTGFKTA